MYIGSNALQQRFAPQPVLRSSWLQLARFGAVPVRIPVFITNKKNHSKEWFFFIGSEGRIRTVDTRIMIPLL